LVSPYLRISSLLDDDLAGGIVAARVVGVSAALDLDLLQLEKRHDWKRPAIG
jgi:hypothetical protein